MEGGSFTGEFGGRVKKKVLETGVYSRRGSLGKQGIQLNGNFMRYLEGPGKGASVCRSSVRWLLSGDPEGYVEEGSGEAHHPIREVPQARKGSNPNIIHFNSIAY